jgi:hypothetical protein
MMKSFLARAATGLIATGLLPAAAMAQAGWTPGAEVVGQPIQVTTNGVTNTWTAANGQLCLGTGGVQECVPYNAPFQAGQPQTLTSSCNATETWLASATNQPPTQGAAPERGR